MPNAKGSLAIVVAAMTAALPGSAQNPDGERSSAVAQAQAILPSLADPATQVLALEEERNRRLTIPVMIEGQGPYDFMIDTGSQATAVTHAISAGLGLRTLGTATLVGMASRRSVNVVEVARLEFGQHKVEDISAPVLDATHVGADGIIGLDSLQDLRVLIDFREKTIALEDVSDKENRRGFEIVVRARSKLGQLLITDALVEGIRATVIIDTGAQASLANNALRERLRAKHAAEVTTMDVNGVSLMGQMSLVRELTIAGLSLRNVPLTFADAPAFEALGLHDTPVLSLGMQHLELFDRVAIDFSRQRVLFDVPKDVARAMRQARQRGSRAPH